MPQKSDLRFPCCETSDEHGSERSGAGDQTMGHNSRPLPPHRPPCHHISKFPNALRNNFPQNGHFHIADHGRGEPAQAESRLILLRLGDLKQRSDFIVSLDQQSRHSPVWKLLRVATVASWGWNVGAVMASFRVPHNYKWSRANNKTYKIVTFYIDFCQWASSAPARR